MARRGDRGRAIDRDSDSYAATFVQEIKEAVASLSRFAQRCRVVPEFADEPVRELLVRPYRLVYQISDEKVIVLALVHGARRIGRP
ncbi:MAG: type II toxin-antitoxin system RelE/ParE family toxin [Chloroflexi bacterium]|nr:type II toxin-antitoxin system RelE/ParE family toxin [Chloroflexota bacterium]